MAPRYILPRLRFADLQKRRYPPLPDCEEGYAGSFDDLRECRAFQAAVEAAHPHIQLEIHQVGHKRWRLLYV